MGRPSIGDAVTVATEKEKKRDIHELTVLNENSEESIYYLIFSKTEKGGIESNE